METLKFKVGDNVRVKSLEWYNSNKDANGLVYIDEQGVVFDKTMAKYCGEIVQIEEVHRRGYFVKGNIGFFEDWMLEDEAVNEEKKQEKNKNSIETKKMAKEKVFEFLGGTKIICFNLEKSHEVQKKLFELGCKHFSDNSKEAKDAYVFYIGLDLRIHIGTDFSFWVKVEGRIIEVSEILAIKLQEEKPKFDPKSLRPFDKVLVRNSSTDIWRARFFDLYVNGMCETASGEKWVFCIPYNEETKHLHYNANRAPEFYIGGEDF